MNDDVCVGARSGVAGASLVPRVSEADANVNGFGEASGCVRCRGGGDGHGATGAARGVIG